MPSSPTNSTDTPAQEQTRKIQVHPKPSHLICKPRSTKTNPFCSHLTEPTTPQQHSLASNHKNYSPYTKYLAIHHLTPSSIHPSHQNTPLKSPTPIHHIPFKSPIFALPGAVWFDKRLKASAWCWSGMPPMPTIGTGVEDMVRVGSLRWLRRLSGDLGMSSRFSTSSIRSITFSAFIESLRSTWVVAIQH